LTRNSFVNELDASPLHNYFGNVAISEKRGHYCYHTIHKCGRE
jgi:hypothetical protein